MRDTVAAKRADGPDACEHLKIGWLRWPGLYEKRSLGEHR